MTSLVMAAIAILASVHAVAAQPPATRSYEIRGDGSFEIDAPAWKDAVSQPPGGRPPNISLVGGGGDDSAPARSGRTALSLPGYPWAVALDLSGFTVTGDETSAERSARMVSAESADRTVYLSVFIEKQPTATNARGCRTRYQERLARSPLMKDVRVQSSETESLAFAEYTIERYDGSTINQKHVNTYLAHEDVCVDLHLSKVRFTSGDLGLFVHVVRSLAIEPSFDDLVRARQH